MTISVAPMMDYTDRHSRYFHRLLSRHLVLYTEMISPGAILFGDRERFLAYDAAEHPVVLQLGGSDPEDMAACARIAEEWGYDEVNINVGCPSDRVQSGKFGACLMREPELVAECFRAMRGACAIPVTVKCRLGVDEHDSFDDFMGFITPVAAAGCTTFIIHARKAWLNGLSPKENREVPPLRYEFVHRLKAARPDLTVEINGGIQTLDAAAAELAPRDGVALDGVMIGRAAVSDPWMLHDVDARFHGAEPSTLTRDGVVEAYLPYIEHERSQGIYLSHLVKPLFGLFAGQPGARAWRRTLSEDGRGPDAGPEVVRRALEPVMGALPG